jgi:integrase
MPDQRSGEEHSPERPVVALPSLLRLLDCVPPRYRAMLLLATFAGLRFGELAALRRSDLDLDGCVVRVVRSTAQMNDGRPSSRSPSHGLAAGRLAFPREIVGELRWHLECFAEPGDDGLLFVGPQGGRLRRSNFRDLRLVALKDARNGHAAGARLPDLAAVVTDSGLDLGFGLERATVIETA